MPQWTRRSVYLEPGNHTAIARPSHRSRSLRANHADGTARVPRVESAQWQYCDTLREGLEECVGRTYSSRGLSDSAELRLPCTHADTRTYAHTRTHARTHALTHTNAHTRARRTRTCTHTPAFVQAVDRVRHCTGARAAKVVAEGDQWYSAHPRRVLGSPQQSTRLTPVEYSAHPRRVLRE